MNKIKYSRKAPIFPCILSLLIFTSTIFQSTASDTLVNGFPDSESYLQYQFELLRSATTDQEKITIGASIEQELSEILLDPASFFDPFDSLTLMGKIYTADSTLRIYSYNVPLLDGSHHYYAFIQRNEDKLELFRLKHVNTVLDSTKVYDHNNWYGALYYSVRVHNCTEGKFYMVLGLDFNNHITNRKIIDVFQIKEGRLEFGKPIFPGSPKKNLRKIFEYSSRVSMMLRFDSKHDMIVFDHLSPPNKNLKDQFQFYGPDFSYDGMRLNGCQWELIMDLDLREPHDQK